MIGIVVRALARPLARHHSGGRMAVHAHVAHRRRVRRRIPTGPRPIRLIDHRLDNPSSCIDEPVVNLEDGEPRVLGQLFLLVL